MTPPTREDFEFALQNEIQRARNDGKRLIGVRSGDLHRKVGGIPVETTECRCVAVL